MAAATDNFTDTATTNLSAHTADTGETWATSPSMGGNMVISATGDQVQGTGLINDGHHMSFVPATAEYDITLSLSNNPAGVVTAGINGRQSTSANTRYWGFWHGTNGRWELRQIVAGSSTTLSTAATNNPEGTTGDLKMEIRDATKKLFWGATELLSSTDNTISAAGRPGIIGGDSSTSRATTYVVVDAAAGGGAITGTVSFSFTPAGVLSGTGALTGSVSTAFASVGALSGTGALSSSIPTTLTSIGALTGTGTLTSTLVAGFTVISVLTGIGALSSVAASVFGIVGVSTGIGALVSAVANVFSITGSITGTGNLTGTNPLSFIIQGTLFSPTAGGWAGEAAAGAGYTSAAVLTDTWNEASSLANNWIEEDSL